MEVEFTEFCVWYGHNRGGGPIRAHPSRLSKEDGTNSQSPMAGWAGGSRSLSYLLWMAALAAVGGLVGVQLDPLVWPDFEAPLTGKMKRVCICLGGEMGSMGLFKVEGA